MLRMQLILIICLLYFFLWDIVSCRLGAGRLLSKKPSDQPSYPVWEGLTLFVCLLEPLEKVDFSLHRKINPFSKTSDKTVSKINTL